MSTTEYYETYWSEQGFCPTGGLPGDLERLYSAHVRSSDAALDVGCGDGRTSGLWLTEHARSYVGVDISAPAIEMAQRAGLDARLIDDAGTLPFEDASVDVAVAIEVFEHLFDPAGAAAEIRRVLRPGGRLIVTVPNIGHWKQRADLTLRGRWNPQGDDLSIAQPWRDPHIRFFTANALRNLLLHCGFDSVEIGGRSGSIAANFRHLSRFARYEPGKVGQWMLERRPGLLGAGLYAVGQLD